MKTCIVWLVVPEEAIDRLAPGKSPTYCVKELDWGERRKGICERNIKLIGFKSWIWIQFSWYL